MAAAIQSTTIEPAIIQWLVDTRPLWPVPPQSKPRDEVAQLKTVTTNNSFQASRALSLLTPTEQTSVLRYYHLKDAKMSLVSHLLKHLIISKYAPISWANSTISRDVHGKPCFNPPLPSQPGMDFNVSHQAGIVSLIAVVGIGGRDKIEVGTDVVCWNERLTHDYRSIEEEGFFKWVDIHADVFAASEVSYMKLAPVDIDHAPDGVIPNGFDKDKISRCQRRNEILKLGQEDGTIRISSNEIIDKKLRRFYACWCLREAYIKMTGEALLAPWLKELEILDVKAPAVNERLENVLMELIALGKGYMVGGAIRPAAKIEELQLKLGQWKHLDLEKDILAFSELNS
ncbi:4 -phosphopantetheinyl transferase [Hyphodiscus hymeniophilus]|uniref:holo-[acyl-carrier-protein] synthase n=1 Tax=Hyphodiscus hymeniophilus TaxID=353542 RepID=A0A9P6VM89_9HELO|nr:4 -phosphopantetheinyl transferase [Hyphodiscus hymeniophilus]